MGFRAKRSEEQDFLSFGRAKNGATAKNERGGRGLKLPKSRSSDFFCSDDFTETLATQARVSPEINQGHPKVRFGGISVRKTSIASDI